MFFSSSDAWTIDCEKKIDGSESNESNGTSCVRKRKKLISVFKYVFLAPPLSNGCPPPSVHPKEKTPINTDLPWKLHQIKILFGEKKEKDPSNFQWKVCNILSILCVGWTSLSCFESVWTSNTLGHFSRVGRLFINRCPTPCSTQVKWVTTLRFFVQCASIKCSKI